MNCWRFLPIVFFLTPAALVAGIYSQATDDSGNAFDAPIPGFMRPGAGVVSSNNQVNPAFTGWASGVVVYSPSAGVSTGFKHSEKALGTVTGDIFDVVSLGDLSTAQINSNTLPGFITLSFDIPITNGVGKDFAIFENGLLSQFTTVDGSVAGQLFGELAYVEVSTDGINFARFPSVSQTASAVGTLGTIDSTGIFNLAGKHSNGNGESWGTPFDLDSLQSDTFVLNGLVNLSSINYVRVVDIPGSGAYLDSLGNPIYDAWQTTISGGFDLEAIGVLNQVPEPSTWMLMGMGLAGLFFLYRTRKSLRSHFSTGR